MAIYIALIMWCLSTSYLSQHIKSDNKRLKNFIMLLPMLGIFIISAIRYNVGTDFSGTYLLTYYRLLKGDNATMTIIPTIIYKAIIKSHANVQWFFVITSFIISFFTYKSIKEQSRMHYLSYFIFICGCYLFFSFNGIRQAVVMSVFYYSLKYLDINDDNIINLTSVNKYKLKKEIIHPIKYIILNTLSIGFHISGVVFIPLFFLLKKRISTKTKIIIILGCLAFSNLLLPYVFRLINMTRYSYYIVNDSMFSTNSLNLSMYINIILLICYEFIFIRYKDKKNTTRDIVYSNIHFIGLIVTLFVTRIPMAYRIFYSFRYIDYLSIPNLIGHCNPKNRKIIVASVMILFFLYFCYMIWIKNSHSALPYSTFLSVLGNGK